MGQTQHLSIYMLLNVKVGYNQSYDSDTETGHPGDVQEAITSVQSAEAFEQL